MRSPETSAARQEFYSEAQEMIEQLAELLGTMRGAVPQGDAPAEAVNTFFRHVHSLKGLSGMLGFSTISFLAHELESLLAELRLGRLSFSEELIGLLEGCLGAFSELLAAQQAGVEPAVNVQARISQIESFLARRRIVGEVDIAEQVELPESLLGALTEYERGRLMQNLRRNSALYRVRTTLDFATFDVQLEQLGTQIKGFGEVITTLPSGGGPGEDRLHFELLVAAGLEEAELRSRLAGTQVEAVPYRLRREAAAPAPPPKRAVEPAPAYEVPSVRVSLDKIDAVLGGIGDLLLFKTQLGRLVEELRGRHGMSSPVEMLAKSVQRLEKSILGLQDRLVGMRLVPVRSLFARLAHLTQKLGRDLGKQIELVTRGADTELDKMVVDEMTDPLLHLVRNAVDHGIEPPEEREELGKPRAGRIQIRASHQGKRILIEVEDDGRGIDSALVWKKAEERGLVGRDAPSEERDVFGLLFEPGFSTRDKVTETSGRGIGMDIVKRKVVKLGGAIEIATRRGAGTRWTLVLPVTLAIIPSLIVRVADQIYAVPMSSVSRTYDLAAGDVPGGISDEGFDFEGTVLPVHRLDQIFELERGADEPPPYLLVAHSAERKMGFLVHEIRGREEIVVKPLGRHLAGVRGIAGAAELGEGPPVLVLDVGALVAEVTGAGIGRG
jgi:two-component system chemotaxis sensor kinase CheA